ncbi:hypothetical protein F5Y16DRAFT_415248 [Xylariaceae sp. FL0255]|nr:hypothetical protein F5Y16DRAFT_415248 [Xylariaceae sp. FL0255]
MSLTQTARNLSPGLCDLAKTEPLGADLGIYVNPYVRVAYGPKVLFWMGWVQKWERLFTLPQFVLSRIASLPKNNPHRAVQEGDGFTEEVWINHGEGGGYWQSKIRQGRTGMFCGIRGMMVMKAGERGGNANWERLKVPGGQNLKYG